MPDDTITVCMRLTHLLPPTALSLICNAVMPISLQRAATSCAANIAAYGDAWGIIIIMWYVNIYIVQ